MPASWSTSDPFEEPFAALELRPHDVHPSLQQPPDVGEVGFFLLGLAAAPANLVEVDGAETVEELFGQYLVDPSATPWAWVDAGDGLAVVALMHLLLAGP